MDGSRVNEGYRRQWHTARLRVCLVATLVASSLLLTLSPSGVIANNWGAKGTGCLAASRDSKCTDDDGQILVLILGSVYNPIRDAVEATLNDDFNPIDGIVAQVVTQSSYADVVVLNDDYGPTDWWAYETCVAGTIYEHDIPLHSYCEQHQVIFNDYHRDNFDISARRKYIVCHEIGHVLGLRHANASNHPNTYFLTCMNNDGLYNSDTTDPSNVDEGHLEDNYPHPPG